MKARISYWEDDKIKVIDIKEENLPAIFTFNINRRKFKVLINEDKIAKLQFRKDKWREISLKTIRFVEEMAGIINSEK